MSRHDADLLIERGRVQGIHQREQFAASRNPQRAIELHRLEQLRWPRNLFGEPASIAELLADMAPLPEQIGEKSRVPMRMPQRGQMQCIADAMEPVRPRLRCHLFLVEFVQERVERRGDADAIQRLLIRLRADPIDSGQTR